MANTPVPPQNQSRFQFYRTKVANPTYSAVPDASGISEQGYARREALTKLLKMFGAAGLAGGSFAGLKHLNSEMNSTPALKPRQSFVPTPIPFSVYGKNAGWEDAWRDAAIPSRIAEGVDNVGGKLKQMGSDGFNWAADNLMPTPDTSNVLMSKWGPTAGMLAVGAGGIGGFKLVDSALNAEKKLAEKRKLEEARRAFDESIIAQYKQAMQEDGDDEFGINALYDLMVEKQAAGASTDGGGNETFTNLTNWWAPLEYAGADQLYKGLLKIPEALAGYKSHDLWEGYKGLTNAAVAGMGIGGATLGYNLANRDDAQRKALEQALKIRAAKRHTGSRLQFTPQGTAAGTSQ